MQESTPLQTPLPAPPPSDDDGPANSDEDPMTLTPSPPLPPDPFLHAPVLTQEQLLHRRASRLRHLLRIYRAQYWGLLEEMRSKYRRFYLRHGKSGWRRDAGPGPSGLDRNDPDLPPGEMKRPHAPEPPGGSDVSRCGAQNCLAKPLLLSSYCYTHILQEPRQRLYRPCSFIVRRGSGKNANVLCQKPVLQAVSPPLCPTHFQQTQKQSVRSLRKAGIVLPPGSASKSAPNLHHFVAEYVRVILSKRRALRITQGRGETSVATRRELTQAGTSKQGTLQRNAH